MSDKKKKKININLDPSIYAVTNINIAFNEESFMFLINSGNQARRFFVSPKHAKRIYMLLKKQIKQYENKFGKLQTKLPEKKGETSKKQIGFKPRT